MLSLVLLILFFALVAGMAVYAVRTQKLGDGRPETD